MGGQGWDNRDGPSLPFTDSSGRATLRTIADLAGMHISTVSRVLNDPEAEGKWASRASAERIRRIAESIGYHPNPHAASLRTQRSRLLGVLVPRLVDIVLATIYDAIEEASADLGYATFVANTYDDPEVRRQRTDMVLSRRVDGIIFGDACLDEGFVDQFAERGVPYVLVSRRAGSHPSVTCDDFLGGQLAAGHLLGLGHRRLGVIAGQPYASTGVDRTAGFVSACEVAGVSIAPERIVHSRFDTEGGREAMMRLLAVGRPPTAVFAVNDFAAIGAMGALRDAGQVVGRDVALVGYNDVPLAASLPIPLTSIRSPMQEMGRQAVQLLVRRIAGETVGSLRIVPELVARESSLGATGNPDAASGP